MVMRAPRLQKESARVCRALGLVAGCCLLSAGCGKDTRSQLGSMGGSAGKGEAACDAGGGDAGAGDDGCAGSTRPDGCFDLSHFEDTMRMKWDLRVIGTGFEADEGSRVRLVITFSGAPSYGLAETTIQNGSFDFLMPKAVEPYTGMGVYIDTN